MESNFDFLKHTSAICSNCDRSKYKKDSLCYCPLLRADNQVSTVDERIEHVDLTIFIRKQMWETGRARMLLESLWSYEEQVKAKCRESLSADGYERARIVLDLTNSGFYHEVLMKDKGSMWTNMEPEDCQNSLKGKYSDDTGPARYIYDPGNLNWDLNGVGPVKEFIIAELKKLFKDLYPNIKNWKTRLSLAIREYDVLVEETVSNLYYYDEDSFYGDETNSYDDSWCSYKVADEPSEEELDEKIIELAKKLPDIFDNVSFADVMQTILWQDSNGVWNAPDTCLICTDKKGRSKQEVIKQRNHFPVFSQGEQLCQQFEEKWQKPWLHVSSFSEYLRMENLLCWQSVECTNASLIVNKIEKDIKRCVAPRIYKTHLMDLVAELKKNAEELECKQRENVDRFCRIMIGEGLFLNDTQNPTKETNKMLKSLIEKVNKSMTALRNVISLDYRTQQSLYVLWMILRIPSLFEICNADNDIWNELQKIKGKLESATGLCNHEESLLEYYDMMSRDMGMNIEEWINAYDLSAKISSGVVDSDVPRLPPYCPVHLGKQILGRYPEFDRLELLDLPRTEDELEINDQAYVAEWSSEIIHGTGRLFLFDEADTLNCFLFAKKYDMGIKLLITGDGVYDWIKNLYGKLEDQYIARLREDIDFIKGLAFNFGVCDSLLCVPKVSRLADFLIENGYVNIVNIDQISLRKRYYSENYDYYSVDEIIETFLKQAKFNWYKFDNVFKYETRGKKEEFLTGKTLHDAFTKKDNKQGSIVGRNVDGDIKIHADYRTPVYLFLLRILSGKGQSLDIEVSVRSNAKAKISKHIERHLEKK